MSDDAAFIKYVGKIEDPITMLRTIISNEQFLGYDPYYKDLREALLTQGEKIVEKYDELRKTKT